MITVILNTNSSLVSIGGLDNYLIPNAIYNFWQYMFSFININVASDIIERLKQCIDAISVYILKAFKDYFQEHE